jgi:hypothetical protein
VRIQPPPRQDTDRSEPARAITDDLGNRTMLQAHTLAAPTMVIEFDAAADSSALSSIPAPMTSCDAFPTKRSLPFCAAPMPASPPSARVSGDRGPKS